MPRVDLAFLRGASIGTSSPSRAVRSAPSTASKGSRTSRMTSARGRLPATSGRSWASAISISGVYRGQSQPLRGALDCATR